MVGRILPVEEADVLQARRLAERYPSLSPRDLIHLAMMIRHRLSHSTTADIGFDRVKEVRRIDPRDWADP
jgi:hypothetical protein